MKKYNHFLRAISLALISSFILEQVSFAAPDLQKLDIGQRIADSGLKEKKQNLEWAKKTLPQIPESIATIEDAWKAEEPIRHQSVGGLQQVPPKLVYLLQDAHTNTSGQLNLAKLLDVLLTDRRGGVPPPNTDGLGKPRARGPRPYIFVEAGLGDNSLSFFRQYGTQSQRKQVAEKYLRQGTLHGEEYLDLTSNHDFIIWGVEDLNLYKKALEDYKQVA